ncbi:MAG: dienelactone hydrolase [Burkholderiales bacterium]|nr:dienelactone hydrolase [Burkholderiales bacterium]
MASLRPIGVPLESTARYRHFFHPEIGMRQLFIGIITAMCSTLSCAGEDTINVQRFQPPIISDRVPLDGDSRNTGDMLSRVGLSQFEPLIESYNGKGHLLASWTPSKERMMDRPTFIIVHGGHGVANGDIETAWYLHKTYDANVLVLDSYWSRGRTENWLSWNEFGANMRILDGLAAARFTKSQGADPLKTYLYGDSQGGWTVLRMFSGHNLAPEVKSLYAGGISLYPNCFAKEHWYQRAPNKSTDGEFAPPLGPYAQPVIVFTGTADQATPVSQCDTDKALKTTERWTVFEGGTHAWDFPTNGVGRPSVDGKCSYAKNKYNHFPMCYSESHTRVMKEQIQEYLIRHGAVDPVELAAVKTPADRAVPKNRLEVNKLSEAERAAVAQKIMDAVGFK